jgi:hypothetical protein
VSAAVPRIVIEPKLALPPLDADAEPLDLLIQLIVRQRTLPQALTRNVVAGLMEEGRRFAATPAGGRWRSILASSALATKGWELWNLLEMDGLIAEPPENGDTPGTMIEDILRALQALRLEDFARLAGDVALHDRARRG